MVSFKVSHNHLRKFIEDNPDRDIDFFTNPIFCMELSYSSFIVPTFPMGDRRAIYLLNHEVIPLFTDMEEYNRMYGGDVNLTPAAYDFDYILSANTDMAINPLAENLLIEIDCFKDKPETPFFEYDSIFVGYNCLELELVARNIKNRKLFMFIRDPSRIYCYDAFFTLLKKSVLLSLVYPDVTGNVADLTDSVAPIKVRDDGFLELFTGIDQIERSPDSYVQVVNLAQFFEMAIRFDFEGVVLNPDTNDVRIDREMILLNFEQFRDNYDPSKYMQAHNYAFKLVKD